MPADNSLAADLWLLYFLVGTMPLSQHHLLNEPASCHLWEQLPPILRFAQRAGWVQQSDAHHVPDHRDGFRCEALNPSCELLRQFLAMPEERPAWSRAGARWWQVI
jgi:hypothetical protein